MAPDLPTGDHPVRVPDLSERPLQLVVERDMSATPDALYRAWTAQFDRWFAAPGSILMRAAVNQPFFFETDHAIEDGGPATRHPHYGRFLRLVPDELVELTWVTGDGGTEGAETVVTVELAPTATGTHLKLTHAGWPNQPSRDRTERAWPDVLAHLDEQLQEPRPPADPDMLTVHAERRIAAPVQQVFEAVTQPLSFFASSISAPLTSGATVEWSFADVGTSLTVHADTVEPARVSFRWSASAVDTAVELNLIAERADGVTLVQVTEDGWPKDEQGISRALQQTQGWTDFLCCLQAQLQHGINLRGLPRNKARKMS